MERIAMLGWTQKSFAARISCDEDTVSRWYTGKTPVPGAIAEYFRVAALLMEALR